MKVLVIGGGVAGSVSAIALRRIGAEVTVVEAYPDPAGDVGSFISLAANGLRGLDALGCLDRVRARGFEVERQRVWSGSGKLLGDVPRGRRDGSPLRSVTLLRGHLVAELRQAALEAGAELITGDRCVDLSPVPAEGPAPAEDAGPRREVRLASGTRLDCDLLVGADGIWSSTRRWLNPTLPQPSYAGLFTVSGVAPGSARDDRMTENFNLVFGRNGAFIYLPAPDGTVWWSAQVAAPASAATVDIDAFYAREPVPAAILAASTGERSLTLNHTLEPVPVWHRGNVVLVGDAAQPIGSGQGASMAIEAAVDLAATLPSLPAYEAARRTRVTKMLKAASDNSDVKRSGPVRLALMSVIMPLVFRHFYTKATDWLYDYEPAVLAPVPARRSGSPPAGPRPTGPRRR